MKKNKKRSAISWVIEFAGQKKPNYIFSVLLAMCKVVFGLMPYLYMADIVKKLLEMHAGTLDKDMSLLTASIIKMAVFWLLCRVCHAISTTLSHAATFEVLANTPPFAPSTPPTPSAGRIWTIPTKPAPTGSLPSTMPVCRLSSRASERSGCTVTAITRTA